MSVRPIPFGNAKAVVRYVSRSAQRMLHPVRRRRALSRLAQLDPQRILVVCHGNICRSPFAAARLRAALESPPTRSVASAGFIRPGRPCPDPARTAAAERGINLGTHRSAVLTRDAVQKCDLCLVMDAEQRRKLVSEFGASVDRIVLLGDLDPDRSHSRAVEDPEGRPLEVFASCYDRITRCVDSIAGTLLK